IRDAIRYPYIETKWRTCAALGLSRSPGELASTRIDCSSCWCSNQRERQCLTWDINITGAARETRCGSFIDRGAARNIRQRRRLIHLCDPPRRSSDLIRDAIRYPYIETKWRTCAALGLSRSPGELASTRIDCSSCWCSNQRERQCLT